VDSLNLSKNSKVDYKRINLLLQVILMIHKKYSKILEVKKTKMQAKVKKNSHIKTNKKSIKTQMTLTQIKKVKKTFHIRNLITTLNHFKTIILKKILHKIRNHKQGIYKKLQELRKDMKKTLGKTNNGDKAILRKI